MSSGPLAFDTQHEDLIHDAQVDYYGRRLATASSDRTVRLWSVAPGQAEKFICSLSGHEGPVWQVAWAHPKFGSLLASCSYDGRVIIWKEQTSQSAQPPQQAQTMMRGAPAPKASTTSAWIKVKEHRGHESSVNSIAWAPVEYGLSLACGSSDGHVSILSYVVEEGSWRVANWNAHQIGCNAVAWCPPSSGTGGSLFLTSSPPAASSPPIMRLASGGCDNLVKIWIYVQGEEKWTLEHELGGHSDWVRDVAWAPHAPDSLVSCSQDRTVLVWRYHGGTGADSAEGRKWTSRPLSAEPFPDALWRVTWSPAGNLLAVAGGDNRVSMWREMAADGSWECLSNVDQAALAQQQ